MARTVRIEPLTPLDEVACFHDACRKPIQIDYTLPTILVESGIHNRVTTYFREHEFKETEFLGKLSEIAVMLEEQCMAASHWHDVKDTVAYVVAPLSDKLSMTYGIYMLIGKNYGIRDIMFEIYYREYELVDLAVRKVF